MAIRSGRIVATDAGGKSLMFPNFDILDISQSVSESTACFPGDVPFSKVMTLTYADSQIINLTAITMSPHVGTHADAPSHIDGDMSNPHANAGALPLVPYVGPVTLLDLTPMDTGEITADIIKSAQSAGLHERVLFKTQSSMNEGLFKDDYAFIGVSAVEYLASSNVRLVGLDTPSVDHINSKDLATHHALTKHGFYWLENLNLQNVEAGEYFLVAAPLKLVSAEAAPVRALLLRSRS
jgi:arylformamidase